MDRDERRILESVREHLTSALRSPPETTDEEIRESLQLIERLREEDD